MNLVNLNYPYPLVTLLGAPLLTKLLGMKDSMIVLLGAPAHALARVIFALAEVPWLFYFGKRHFLHVQHIFCSVLFVKKKDHSCFEMTSGAVVSSLGPTVAPVLRSMTSKVVSIEERGKLYFCCTERFYLPEKLKCNNRIFSSEPLNGKVKTVKV